MCKLKILIIEDNNLIALNLQEQLKRLGHNIIKIVSNGKNAIKLTEETNPDLILMDIQLKGDLDGIETAQIIKDKYNTPIIYLTAYYTNELLDRAQKTQPVAYITKPYEEEELQAAVQSLQKANNL